ncbi:MAG: CooT family nickel-binding protein [Desulfobacterales bacterium]
MCLSTVCLHLNDKDKEIMKDVARIESDGNGVWLIGLLGEKKFVQGSVRTIDLVDEHLVVLEPIN